METEKQAFDLLQNLIGDYLKKNEIGVQKPTQKLIYSPEGETVKMRMYINGKPNPTIQFYDKRVADVLKTKTGKYTYEVITETEPQLELKEKYDSIEEIQLDRKKLTKSKEQIKKDFLNNLDSQFEKYEKILNEAEEVKVKVEKNKKG